jgi:glycosyltransferase involved in cell wall biosynthesis
MLEWLFEWLGHARAEWRHPALRILHVTSSLDPGGVETWLLRLARLPSAQTASPQLAGGAEADTCAAKAHRPLLSAILVLGNHEGALAADFRRAGVAVWCVPRRGLLRSLQDLSRFLRETGPWDVVHSHVFRYSLVVQFVALVCRVPLRITHSHHSDLPAGSPRSRLRQSAASAVGFLLRNLSHEIIACSTPAAQSLFGVGAGRHFPFLHLPCGIDERAFREPLSSAEIAQVRASVGIPAGAIVLGHVGRFVPEKGHQRLLEAAAIALQSQPGLFLLLVGDGPLRPAMESLAHSLGIWRSVAFPGNRKDVPRLLCAAMDGFVFPSHQEGLGVAAIEAQAAGLPCLLSSAVPPEASLFPARNRWFPGEASAAELAEVLLAFANSLKPVAHAKQVAEAWRFPDRYRLEHNAQVLASLYQQADAVTRSFAEVRQHGQPA